MRREQAADVARYAKQLFPRTTDERIVAVGSMVEEFDNPDFAMQCLLEHAKTSESLNIPAVRQLLEAEDGRRRESANERRAKAIAQQQAVVARREEERRAAEDSWEPINHMLDELEPTALESAKAEVAKDRPFFANANPRTNKGLRVLIYERLAGQHT